MAKTKKLRCKRNAAAKALQHFRAVQFRDRRKQANKMACRQSHTRETFA